MPIFPVNIKRKNPYPTWRFLLYFDNSTTPVALLSKISALNRKTDPIPYKEGGNPIILQGVGRTNYGPIILERGITQDKDFITWADYTQRLDNGVPITSLKNLRREIRIQLLNEEGQPVHGYIVHQCWVSEFQALPDLDAGASSVAIEHIKIENHGWESDPNVVEILEP